MESDPLLFAGQVVAITGAGRGLGRAYALLLARLGARIVVNDIGAGMVAGSPGSSEPARAVVAEIEAAGGTAIADLSDIARPEGARSAIQAAIDAFGRIDALINNAGTSTHKPFEAVSAEELEAMLRLHVGGHFHATQAAWPHFVAQGHGRVVMTSSGSGLFGSSDNHHYAAAKGAVAGLTRSLAIDGGPRGIAVNAVAPLAATRLADNIADPVLRQAFFAHVRPEQVAPLVAWLCTRACPVNGELFEVGGGLVARILVAEGQGHFDPDHDIAWIQDNLPAIMREDGYALPRCGEETAAGLLRRIGISLGA